MEIIKTKLKDVFIIEPKIFGDNRGWNYESYSKIEMEKNGLFYNFVQDNHSFSAEKGTVRGLHFQYGEHSQAKLVRCVRGTIKDFVVDMRKGSPTYMQWTGVELSDKNNKQLLVPRGFLHGFITLTDNVEFLYKLDNYYDYESDRNVRWNDKDIGIKWGIENPIVSEKDGLGISLKEYSDGYL